MKDNEIIKALECCAVHGLLKCEKCPKKNEGVTCMYALSKDALDLINHLKRESNKYRYKAQAQKGDIARLNKQVAEQKAEIERLKDTKFKMIDKFRDTLADEYLRLCNYNDFNKLNLERIVDTLNEVFDNLVKEMVGDAE